jgi:SSS family solute:Na+ symporter
VNIYVALLIGYSAALTGLGLWIARGVRGPADFFVAGRKLTWPYVAATMLAANIGAGATVGATGLAYQQGVSAWFWNGSAAIGSLLLATVVGPRIWTLASERGYLTIGDFLEDRYGQTVRVIIASLIWDSIHGTKPVPKGLRNVMALRSPRRNDSVVIISDRRARTHAAASRQVSGKR